MRTMVFWGLYWGPPILGNYHFVWPVSRYHLRGPQSREGNMPGQEYVSYSLKSLNGVIQRIV